MGLGASNPAGVHETGVGDIAQATKRKLSTNEAIDATMQWLAKHPEILEGYDEEWVAVWDEQVIAHGPSMAEVADEARQLGYDDPLMVPVMPYPRA